MMGLAFFRTPSVHRAAHRAAARQEEQKKRDQELAELREALDAGYREVDAEAPGAPPPATVRAYQEVYGHFPRGWPPEVGA